MESQWSSNGESTDLQQIFNKRNYLHGFESWRVRKTSNWISAMGFLRHEGMYEYI